MKIIITMRNAISPMVGSVVIRNGNIIVTVFS